MTTRWRSATADCARSSRTHPRQSVLRTTDVDYPIARQAKVRMLHQVAAMLRCRPHPRGELRRARDPQRRRSCGLLESRHRDRECDESKPVALRALDSWRESRRLLSEYFADNRTGSRSSHAALRAKASLRSSRRGTDVYRDKRVRRSRAVVR